MKLNKWLYGAAALAMLAACSDKDIAPGSGTENSTHNGTGYISIELGMPTTPVSRANDDFGDGLVDEYKVNNLGILFFTGREENANFYKGYDISPAEFTNLNPENDQITSIKRVTFPVDITQNSESLWALAVVNYNDIMTIDNNNVVTLKKEWKAGTKELDETATIQDLLKMTTSEVLHNVTTTEGFFMTNTPYTTSPGTGNVAPSGLIHLLAFVDKEKIKETKAEAENNPAAEIFVERAVAKVEVFKAAGDITPNTLLDIDEIYWAIDNTEPSTYVIRNLELNNTDPTKAPDWLTYTHTTDFKGTPTFKYRFVGNSRFSNNATIFTAPLDMYRIYFGVDPQGKGIATNTNTMIHLTDETTNVDNYFKEISTTGDSGDSHPQYCYENTFDVEHMDYHNTTRAIIKVKFDVPGDETEFFTRGIDRTTMYTHDDAAASLAHAAIENSDVVAAWTKHFSGSSAPTVSIANLVYNHNSDKCTGKNEWINLTYKIIKGRLEITDIQLFDGSGQADANKVPFLEGVIKDDVLKAINNQVTFNAYVGGVAYYAVRIKHFGDDLTPWMAPTKDNKPVATPDTNTSYGGIGDNANKNYLGRYGVLRNNWYQITISAINKFGEPTIDDLPLDGTPDDKTEVEQAISCKINILSWAKRTQSVEF